MQESSPNLHSAQIRPNVTLASTPNLIALAMQIYITQVFLYQMIVIYVEKTAYLPSKVERVTLFFEF
jgi:hypothetical protein